MDCVAVAAPPCRHGSPQQFLQPPPTFLIDLIWQIIASIIRKDAERLPENCFFSPPIKIAYFGYQRDGASAGEESFIAACHIGHAEIPVNTRRSVPESRSGSVFPLRHLDLIGAAL